MLIMVYNIWKTVASEKPRPVPVRQPA